MRAIKAFLSNIHRFILWLIISVFFWAWIFMLVIYKPAKQKVVVYVDAPEVLDRELTAELDKRLPDGIKSVEVHPFSYDILGTGTPAEADIYIVSEDVLEGMKDMLAPLTDEGWDDVMIIEGKAIGVGAYNAGNGAGCAKDYISYADGNAAESYYICFNRSSLHIGDMNGSADSAAITVAKSLLELP